jgi:hydrogenase maturation factor
MTRGCDDPHHCVTCSDEGVEMRVLAVDEARGLALCEAAGGERSAVEVALVGAVAPGDALLVHAGTALAVLGAEVSA